MKLHLGRMTSKELAEWFGISDSTFRHKACKDKRLEVLKKYARYHFEGEKNKVVYIDEIYEDTFVADEGSPAYKCVRDLAIENWSPNGYDTCAHVAEKIYPEVQERGHQIKASTNYCYVCQGRTELYGSPLHKTTGTRGSSHYEWCKKDEQGNYIPLTEKEQEVKNTIADRYGFTNEEGTYIAEAVHKGRLNKDELWQLYTDVKAGLFIQWKMAVETELGFPIYKCTKLEESIKLVDEAFDL